MESRETDGNMSIRAALFFAAQVGFTRAQFNSSASYCTTDMNNLRSVAYTDSHGKSPDGYCYSHVADYIDAVGYGGIDKGGFDAAIPSAYWTYAYQFAEYLNTGKRMQLVTIETIEAFIP